jgi:DHA1 family inner membrane transport protein
MWVIAALGLLAVPIIALRLPRITIARTAGLRQRFAPLTDVRIVRVLVGTLLAFTGIYVPLTYISSVFGPAVGGSNDRVALLLLVYGLAGTAGNLLAGKLADRYGPRRVVITATVLLAAVFVVMLPVRSMFAVAIPMVALFGITSWSVTAPQQHRVLALSPSGAGPLGISLNAAVLYLAISLSGLIGAAGLNLFGSGVALPVVAAVLVLAAAAVTWLSGPSEQRALAAKEQTAAATAK